jgi:hypothetical protein
MTTELTRRRAVAVTVTGLGTTLAGCLGGDSDSDVPGASFTFERDGTDLTVTHDDGAALTSDNTGEVQIVDISGDENAVVLGTWELPIEDGDSVTVQSQFESGQTVAVRWFTADESEFADLASYDIE